MTVNTCYPVSLLLEGPLFSDELETQPQNFKRKHEVDSLRLVPSKSAANGVHTVYFRPDHRHWALVRLATRYRGLFEIQLHRGMSGEYQLLRQGFTSADLEFLADVLPRPPTEYSPIVYDMLWLVATYDEYLAIARAMADQETFVPRDILLSTAGVTIDDDGFFTRFLRSHLIRPEMDATAETKDAPRKSGRIAVDQRARYTVTNDGSDALEGIVAEYDRIFEQQDFEPLLLNPDLDPLGHLREYESTSTEPPDPSLDEMQSEGGILGEIAESFAVLDDGLDSTIGSPKSNPVDDDTRGSKIDVETSYDESHETDERRAAKATTTRGLDSSTTVTDGRSGGRSSDRRLIPERTAGHNEGNGAALGDSSEDSKIGEFTREEIVLAAVAAATVINGDSLVRTREVKAATWDAVDLSDRSRGNLWETVQEVLIAMDDVHGRRNGHIWAASQFNKKNTNP